LRRQVKDAVERLERQAAFISRLRASAGVSPQDELPLNGLQDRDPHKQAPLFSLFEKSSQMAAAEFDGLLQGRNAKVEAAARGGGNDSGDEDAEEEEVAEGEEVEEEEEEKPRWKEARREKRKRERSAKRGAQAGSSDEDGVDEEEAPGRKKGAKGKIPKAAPKDIKALEAKAAKSGADQVEDFAFSSDED